MMAPHILPPYKYYKKNLLLVLYVGAAATTTCTAFVVSPQTSRTMRCPSTATPLSRHEALPLHVGDGGGGGGGIDSLMRWMSISNSNFLIADGGVGDIINVDTNTASMLGSLGEGLRTVAIGITVIVFFLAGFAYFTAAILIPKAAEQLELECKELAPELWEEYASKLGPGETLATRPDLLQELGNKITPLIEQKIRREQQDRGFSDDGVDATIISSSPSMPPQVIESEQVVSSPQPQSSSSSSRSTTSTVLDAEVVPDENTDTKST
jgi:hypothetical protein